jgi:hypothetical protein
MVSTIHLTCAAVFILSLAAISFLFGYREGRREGAGKGRRLGWRSLHWFCGVVIVVAVLYVVVANWTGRFASHSVLYGEVAATLAFGVSWLAKGAEWRILFAPAPWGSTLLEDRIPEAVEV